MTTTLTNLVPAAAPNAASARSASGAVATAGAKGAARKAGSDAPAERHTGAPSRGAADKSAASKRAVRAAEDRTGAKMSGSGAMQAPTAGANGQGETAGAVSFAAVMAGAATKVDTEGAKGETASQTQARPVGTERTPPAQTVASVSEANGPKGSAQLSKAAAGQVDITSDPTADAAIRAQAGGGSPEGKLSSSPANPLQQNTGGQARTAASKTEAPATVGTVRTAHKVPPEAATASAKAGHVTGEGEVKASLRRPRQTQTVAKGSAPHTVGRQANAEHGTRRGVPANPAGDSPSNASSANRAARSTAVDGQERPISGAEQSDAGARAPAQRTASRRQTGAEEAFAAVVRRTANGESSRSSSRSAAQGGTVRPGVAGGGQAAQPRVVRGTHETPTARPGAGPHDAPATAKAGETNPLGRAQLHVGDASVSVADSVATGQTSAAWTGSAFAPAGTQGVSATHDFSPAPAGAPGAYATAASNAPSDAAPAGQVAEAIRLSAVRGERRMTIRLDPPELGQVRVTLHTRGRDVTATVQADSARTLGELQREATAMVDRLGESGVDIRRIDFSLTDTPTGQHGADTGANSAFGGREGAWQQGDARGGDGRASEQTPDAPAVDEPAPDDEATAALAADGTTINVRM